MKKAITIVIAAVLLSTSSAFAADFRDIKGHWAERTINTLADRGIVDGFTNTEFAPEAEVTRAQYLKMIMEAAGVETTVCRDGECLEAKKSDWYSAYLQSALDKGLIPQTMITGYKHNVEYTVDENGTATKSRVIHTGAFNGNLPITREEMAALTMYFWQYTRTVLTNDNIDISEVKDFADQSSISDWAEQSVKLAAAAGFINGTDNNAFAPQDYTTRAQAATVIERVLNK